MKQGGAAVLFSVRDNTEFPPTLRDMPVGKVDILQNFMTSRSSKDKILAVDGHWLTHGPPLLSCTLRRGAVSVCSLPEHALPSFTSLSPVATEVCFYL